jgi:hypothetical protein
VVVREARKPGRHSIDQSYWRNRGFEGEGQVLDALLDANAVLGDLGEDWPAELEYVGRATKTVDQVWLYCVERFDRVSAREHIDDQLMNGTIAACVHPYLTHLDDIGRTLMRWNGVDRLPAEPMWEDADLPLPENVDDWDWDNAMGKWWERNFDKTRKAREAMLAYVRVEPPGPDVPDASAPA